ncbi:MAG TPA: hypothetical protein VEA69_21615 [Tepidisphaeraceae bacterium]|nr:hypothetical protein [Tepidisphaeraceae bacterium]
MSTTVASNPERALGFLSPTTDPAALRKRLRRRIELQLIAMGLTPPAAAVNGQAEMLEVTEGLLANYRQKSRLLEDYRCPADRRIEAYLESHLADLNLDFEPRLPSASFVLDQHGLAREMSLPLGAAEHASPLLKSYRVTNGVLHNPKSDRRTTKGTFHVAEGGLGIPDDKVAVPKRAFAELFRHAVNPPRDLLTLPYTARTQAPAEVFVTLLLRPMVVPAVPGVTPRKSMEVRFFAPGSLVSNLDFVESIFGNAGDPMLPENDAALDVEHWTGHTGCVILAPHLVSLTKKELGLPPVSQATARQKRDGMCWADPDEKYNGGDAFKVTCRTEQGVIVTIIADNYFGYCKKEVKTQISYAANLYGNAEEEHAGGALVFPSYALGDEYHPHAKYSNNRTFDQVAREHPALMDVKPEGYGVDRAFPNVMYVPEDAVLSLRTQKVTWHRDGREQQIPLLRGNFYVTPWGSKIYIDKHPGSGRFRLIVTIGDGTFCHKPCTVSGGGKSEISKSLLDYMIYGPVYVGDLKKDLDGVEAILTKDHSKRWKTGKAPQDYSKTPTRPLLGDDRTLGSVIKLLTPSPDYTDEYNKWLEAIPSDVLSLVLLIKRLYRPEWGADWRSHFSVDVINGEPGHELKIGDRKAAGVYLRVGFLPNNAWRTFRLRQDFYPAMKVQTEDDISASTVVPSSQVRDLRIPQSNKFATESTEDTEQSGVRALPNSSSSSSVPSVPSVVQSSSPPSLKFVQNCEYRLFQRPDDAIHPGFDKQAEADIGRADNFVSNFEPLTAAQVREIEQRVAEFDRYTPPMQRVIRDGAAAADGGYTVVSAYPRLVDGKPTKNPRYLQPRPDMVQPIHRHLADVGLRFARQVPPGLPVVTAVDAVLLGRRNNPPEAGVRALAPFNPIHYQELPELFMDFVCSLTGKSPSTTGAGSEGALTKGPFNALIPTADLNTALVSFILTGHAGFSTAAGYVGPGVKVDHDLSLLIPELWSRMRPEDRDPKALIAAGHLEPLEDFEHDGKPVLASRLGYRITYSFVRTYFGRLFSNPGRVFDAAMLKPETQDFAAYVDSIHNITEAQQRVARHYFEDGSVELACPPLKALLHVMAHGQWQGKGAHDPELRRMFTREALLASDWYRKRLATKQARDVALWKRHVAYVEQYAADRAHTGDAARLGLGNRLAFARAELARVSAPAYLESLVGTVGADPMAAQ